jgi:hypothetical protein
MKNAFFVIFFLGSLPAFAEGPIEFLNRKAGQMISRQDCRNQGPTSVANPDCPEKRDQKKIQGLQEISEQVYYNQLAQLEIARLQCAVKKSESLNSQQPVVKKSLQRVNETLPYLDAISQEIRTLTSENQILRGRIGGFENIYQSVPVSPEKAKKIDEYKRRNEILKKKMIEYERRLAEIPGSEIPEVRSLIEDRLSWRFGSLKPFSEEDFRKLSETAITRMKNSLKVLENSNSGGNYRLNRDLKIRLAKDPELSAQLMEKNPQSVSDIHRFQCLAEQRDMGGELLMIGSLALPVGGWGLAKLARMKGVLSVPALAKTASQGSRVLGFSSMALGAEMGLQDLINQCLKDDAGVTNNRCEVTLQSIAKEHSQFDCMSSVVLNSAAGAGGILAAKKGAESKAVADFVAKSRASRRAQDLEGAAGLNDQQRVDAAQALLGRNLSPEQRKALIEAHEVGEGFGRYTAQDIEKKREILKAAGFSRAERETLLWKGVAGKGSYKHGGGDFDRELTVDEARRVQTNLVRFENEHQERFRKSFDHYQNVRRQVMDRHPEMKPLVERQKDLQKQYDDFTNSPEYKNRGYGSPLGKKASEMEKNLKAAKEEVTRMAERLAVEVEKAPEVVKEAKRLDSMSESFWGQWRAPETLNAEVTLARADRDSAKLEKALIRRSTIQLEDSLKDSSAKDAAKIAKGAARDLLEAMQLQKEKAVYSAKLSDLPLFDNDSKQAQALYAISKGNHVAEAFFEHRVTSIVDRTPGLSSLKIDDVLIRVPASEAPKGSVGETFHQATELKTNIWLLFKLEDHVAEKFKDHPQRDQFLQQIEERRKVAQEQHSNLIQKIMVGEKGAYEEISKPAEKRRGAVEVKF